MKTLYVAVGCLGVGLCAGMGFQSVHVNDAKAALVLAHREFDKEYATLELTISAMKWENDSLNASREKLSQTEEKLTETQMALAESEAKQNQLWEVVRKAEKAVQYLEANADSSTGSSQWQEVEVSVLKSALERERAETAKMRAQLISARPSVVIYEEVAEEEQPASSSLPWQYPQPIDPTDWIQRTLTPPPRDPWKQIHGK